MGLREEEEDLRAEVLEMENLLSSEPKRLERERRLSSPSSNRRLRLWSNLLMIILLLFILLFLLWKPASETFSNRGKEATRSEMGSP